RGGRVDDAVHVLNLFLRNDETVRRLPGSLRQRNDGGNILLGGRLDVQGRGRSGGNG
nr:hypothetical protein [Tanacetum cinerariifolium]